MPDSSFADKLQTWKALIDTMGARLEELPHLRPEHSELTAVVKEIEALNSQEDTNTARLREITRNRKEAGRRGVELRGRIQAGVHAHFGKRSPLLHEFGFRPLAERSSRRKEEKEGEEKPPAATREAAS